MPDTAQTPELTDQLHAINHRLRRRWTAELAPYELSPHQYRALAALVRSGRHAVDVMDADAAVGAPGSDHPEGMRLNEVAERLRIAPRSATEVVDLLEAKGLARRGPDPRDRRATRVTATEAGYELYSAVRGQRQQQAEEFFAVLDEAERAELSRLLSVVLDANPRQERCASAGESTSTADSAPSSASVRSSASAAGA